MRDVFDIHITMGLKMKITKLRRVHNLIAVLIVLFLGVGGYIAWERSQPKPAPILTEEQIAEQAVIDEWYVPLTPIRIENIEMQASVANDTETRTKGLSGTPYLPEGVVKLFVFEESQEWGFWMKDMKYPIDIIWVDATGKIVHIEESISPATYPMSFVPHKPARYVVETVAGFVEQNKIEVGDTVIIPKDV